MGSALAISSADLGTIEQSMIALNHNINSVNSDIININGKITSFNNDMEDVKNTVVSLEEEIRNFMYEIKGSSNVTNAQNDLLIAQNELKSKYGQYDNVRQLIEIFTNGITSKVSKAKLNKLNKDLLLLRIKLFLTFLI